MPHWALWFLTKFGILIAAPVGFYFELEREVKEGYQNGTIDTNGDSIGIPMANFLVIIIATALIVNLTWLIYHI